MPRIKLSRIRSNGADIILRQPITVNITRGARSFVAHSPALSCFGTWSTPEGALLCFFKTLEYAKKTLPLLEASQMSPEDRQLVASFLPLIVGGPTA